MLMQMIMESVKLNKNKSLAFLQHYGQELQS